MKMMTVFTTPKPYTNPHIATIQRNALNSWIRLGDEVEVIVVGEEAGVAEICQELKIRHIPQVNRNEHGTPLLDHIFETAREHGQGRYLLFANADVILLPDVLSVTQSVGKSHENFLIIGQRIDLDVKDQIDFSDGWSTRLRADASERGRLHKATGSDYFIFPRNCFVDMPAFAIGRAGWDNWMIYSGRLHGWPVVDATVDNLVIHQDHDYSHLPGGQPHYKLPETFENIRLAGGRRAIFEMPDANYYLERQQVKRMKVTPRKILRELEIFPLIKMRSYLLAQVMYSLLHPRKAYFEWRRRLANKMSGS